MLILFMSEMVEVIDEQGNIINSVSRDEARKKNLKTKAAFVVVRNSENQLYISQRSKNKDISPLKWEVGAGGGVKKGETFEDAAIRELKEELGIKSDGLGFLFDFESPGHLHKYKAKIYLFDYDGEIEINREEMEQGKWADKEELLKLKKEGLLCPDTTVCVDKYIEMGII